MVAAVKRAVFLEAMAYDLDTAMGTRWRQCMDGALEAVESVSLAAHDDLKGFVIVVAAMFTNGH